MHSIDNMLTDDVLEACLNSELTAECVAERFAHISTNIQEEL